MSLTIGITGCARSPEQFEPRPKQTRPITIVLVLKGGTCQANYGKKPQHAYRNDTVAWEFVNTCGTDQAVQLDLKPRQPPQENPFTDDHRPWTVSAKANNEGDPDAINLDVRSNATTNRGYDFQISVAGKTYDPRLEVDP